MFCGESEFTDDTVMTIAMCDALMSAGKDASDEAINDELVDALVFWGRKYPDAGYGAGFGMWLFCKTICLTTVSATAQP